MSKGYGVVLKYSYEGFTHCIFDNVLGSARRGLIFTGIQEGTQLSGLTPPGQTEQGIPYHVPSCRVPVGVAGRGEVTRGSGVCSDRSGSLGCAVCML